MLKENGVDVRGVAALVSTEQRMTSPRDIERLSEKVAAHLGKGVDEVKPAMQSLFDGTFKQLFNKAEADITRDGEKAGKLFEIASSGKREGAYSNPLESGEESGSGLLGKPGLTQDTFGFSLGPAKLAEIMAGDALSRMRDPLRRAQSMQKISRAFEELKLQNERLELLAGTKRLRKSMAKEAAMFEAVQRTGFKKWHMIGIVAFLSSPYTYLLLVFEKN